MQQLTGLHSKLCRQDIIQKIDKIHKIYQSRIILTVAIMTCLLILGGCIQQPQESAKTPVAVEAGGSSNTYDYPVKPGTEEWEEIPNSSELVEASQIPDSELNMMSTAGLVESVLNYPFLPDMLTFNSPQQGFEAVTSRFNGLQELLRRRDAGIELIAKYRGMDPLALEKSWSDKKKGSYTLRFTYLETILAQQQVLAGLTDPQLQELLAVTLEKHRTKQQSPEIYGLGHTTWVMGKVLQQINDKSFLQQVSQDPLLQNFLAKGAFANEKFLAVIAEHTERLLTENNHQQAIPNEPGTIGEQEYRVGESNIIPGWRELKARDYLYQLELGDRGMSWHSMSKNDTISYTIHFPSEWTFNGFSIFNDREDNKVAELAPLAQTDISMTEIFQIYQPLEEELIAKEKAAFEDYEVFKLIEKVPVMYGEKPYWYPHTYMISDGRYLFAIIFYSYELSESDQEMYDNIARTFRFE